jgi:hypothetical protein
MGLLSLKGDGKRLEALRMEEQERGGRAERVEQQCSYSLIMNSIAN